jgi:predicted CXXCH cytochrome family protein
LVLRDGDAEKRTTFFVGASSTGDQSEWKPFRSHPPPATGATCTACHEVRDAKWEFAGGNLASNCFQCHNEGEFPKAHTHERGVLAACSMCHFAHGSSESKHLKMAVKTACTQCHF